MTHTIKQGLDLPITGSPEQAISQGNAVTEVAVLGPDYVGMKPTMFVKEGDRVKKGQVIFTDKKTEGVQYTAPAAGVVKAVNRGERRVLLSVVIEIDGDESESFESFSDVSAVTREAAQKNLVASGLWTALRTRPYSKAPALESVPAAIFVNAMDTHPLAANPEVIIAEQTEAFKDGLVVLKQLTDGEVFVAKAPGANVPNAGVEKTQEFAGPHPAGLAGTHIHTILPASDTRTVWSVGYQDVIAIGQLFKTGQVNTDRVISIGGPQASNPRLVRTQVGANLDQLLADEIKSGAEVRTISGSVFGGNASGEGVNFLGRFHNQVSLLEEFRERPLLHYFRAGFNRFSVKNIYISKLLNKKFDFTTTTNGSERAMVPIGAYEKIMPLDILPTQLLRALIVEDMESAINLGALELDEEDLALCTFVCSGKYEYGPILRQNLTRIEKES